MRSSSCTRRSAAFLRIAGEFHQLQRAARQRQPGQAGGDVLAVRDRAHGQQRALGLFRQQVRIGQGARRDHAHHLALDRAFAEGRIADLFADRAGLAELDQLGQVGIERVEGHARHLDRIAARAAARRQRDAQDARGLLGVLEEQLVEVAHAVEDEHGGVLALDAQVLLHHWRDFFGGGKALAAAALISCGTFMWSRADSWPGKAGPPFYREAQRRGGRNGKPGKLRPSVPSPPHFSESHVITI
jgi:hypothetical protein